MGWDVHAVADRWFRTGRTRLLGDARCGIHAHAGSGNNPAPVCQDSGIGASGAAEAAEKAGEEVYRIGSRNLSAARKMTTQKMSLTIPHRALLPASAVAPRKPDTLDQSLNISTLVGVAFSEAWESFLFSMFNQ